MPLPGLFAHAATTNPLPKINLALTINLLVVAFLLMTDALLWAPTRCQIEVATGYGTVPFNRCEEMMGTFSCHTADYDAAICGLPHCPTIITMGSVSQCAITRYDVYIEPIQYETCTGFYQHEIKLCPERQQTMGAALGYISLAKTICALVYKAFCNRALKRTTEKLPSRIHGEGGEGGGVAATSQGSKKEGTTAPTDLVTTSAELSGRTPVAV